MPTSRCPTCLFAWSFRPSIQLYPTPSLNCSFCRYNMCYMAGEKSTQMCFVRITDIRDYNFLVQKGRKKPPQFQSIKHNKSHARQHKQHKLSKICWSFNWTSITEKPDNHKPSANMASCHHQMHYVRSTSQFFQDQAESVVVSVKALGITSI